MSPLLNAFVYLLPEEKPFENVADKEVNGQNKKNNNNRLLGHGIDLLCEYIIFSFSSDCLIRSQIVSLEAIYLIK